MNILIASQQNTNQIAHDLWKDHILKQVDLSKVIDEPQLMQLESWADQVFCLTNEDKRLLSFMSVFKRKIKLWKK